MPFELSFSQHELNQVKSCMFLSKALDKNVSTKTMAKIIYE